MHSACVWDVFGTSGAHLGPGGPSGTTVRTTIRMAQETIWTPSTTILQYTLCPKEP